MILEPQAFMRKICQRVGFTNKDKALLKSQADWGGGKLLQKWQII
jgi:hypothetical protein